MTGLEAWIAQYSAWALGLIEAYGYFGVFLINLIASLTIFFPVPGFALTFGFGAVLNPWLVALAAALGGAIGEVTGYLLGYGSREALKKKYKKWFKKVNKFAEKRGMFVALIVIAATPIPTDLGGIIAGMAKYEKKRFFLAMFIGKLALYTLIAWAGFYGVTWLTGLLGMG